MMTPDLRLLWQRGKLDCRCDACGFESAATSACNRCWSKSLTYLSHEENGGKCLAGGGGGDRSDEAKAAQSVRMKARQAARRASATTPPVVATLDSGVAQSLTLVPA